MHWGHAVSRDLVNWVHLPIFLRPEDKDCGSNCGWFSGSAVPLDNDGLQIFVTDSNHSQSHSHSLPNWHFSILARELPQIQLSLATNDTIMPSEEPFVVIGEIPENPGMNVNLSKDFRDPNVFLGPNGYHYMTLGSNDLNGKGGVILLYRTKTTSLGSDWEFQVGES